jgi:hypothetical protein
VNPIYYAMRKNFLIEFAKANNVRFNDEPLKEGDDEFLNQMLEYTFEPGVVMSVTVRALATGEWGNLVEGVGAGLARLKKWSADLFAHSDRPISLAKFLLLERSYTTDDLTEMLRHLGVVNYPKTTSRVRLCIQMADVVPLVLRGWRE